MNVSGEFFKVTQLTDMVAATEYKQSIDNSNAIFKQTAENRFGDPTFSSDQAQSFDFTNRS